MEPENKIQKKSVQTYAEDMAEVLGADREGLIKKVIHEEEDKEMEKKNLSPDSKKNQVFVILSLTMMLFSAGLVVFLLLKKDNNTVEIPPQFTPIVFTDKTKFIDISLLSKESIMEKVAKEVESTEIKNGAVEGIYLVDNKQIVGLQKFITLVKGSLSFQTENAFLDNFLIGVSNHKNVLDPAVTDGDFFILLKVRSFEDIFPDMRKWERRMFSDLYGFFGIDLNVDTKYLLTKNFEDGIIQNKNARILYDDTNNIVLMYVFMNDNFLLITGTEGATREVILRLGGSKVKK